jgi:putative ABC transport system ATP-binding protein/macrolide transport system ATP-binding/permease protein/lipoprotein-releasing system ATP-binding protein
MLQAQDLFKTYPGSSQSVAAVAGVSFAVSAGEFVAICGRSGSGKSTLLAMLAGLTAPSSGTVRVDGTDLFALSEEDRLSIRRGSIGMVLQFAGLLPTLRAIDNVAFPALVGGSVGGINPYARAAKLLAQVGLADRMEGYPSELSGGEQRRVALARALINRPPLLLCDEPTADLDATTASEVLALLLDLHRRHGTTLVIVTHDEILARHADRIAYLERGRIESTESPLLMPLPTDLPTVIVPSSVAAKVAAPPPAAGKRLGAVFSVLLTRFVLALTLGTCGVAAADWGAGLYQRYQQDERLMARRLLEDAALQRLRADVDRLTAEADGSYSLVLYLQNLDAEAPVFVSAPAVRAFVQVDRDWVEVPFQSSEEETEGVLSLSGKQLFRFTLRPQRERFTELVPGYMHVRFSNAMLVSRDRNGIGGLFERVDEYYVYLKPQSANDAVICEKNQWTSAPLWIGMPPH